MDRSAHEHLILPKLLCASIVLRTNTYQHAEMETRNSYFVQG